MVTWFYNNIFLVVQECSANQLFWKILQKVLEHTCVEVSMLIKLQVVGMSLFHFKKSYKGIVAKFTLHRKWSFSLRISSVNVTKSTVFSEFGHIYCRNPSWETSFFMQWLSELMNFSFPFKWSKKQRFPHKKWSFPFRISSVNVTKSAGICGFGHIYWSNPWWKISFFAQCLMISGE